MEHDVLLRIAELLKERNRIDHQIAELAAEEVDPVDRQAERLALPQAGPGGEGDQRPVPVGHRIRQSLDRLARQRLDAPAVDLRQLGALAG
ncbi:hypothetical protein E4P41_13715 [Geodermatophilus sp. DF01-2]|uniref:hypothetical protein n=1 Tax=Geodermatophilus sp. DF01-2 TaxID=2559610 RepID=UPI0010746D80|nr:hypothetical protein [Geodermatophilus sp. DF01_2]TFV57916.1 hypothetical protein E4P41_13715 [Geodermatophilus sp. DF01_2]